MNYRQAKKMRQLIEQFAAQLSDEEALDGGELLFPRWSGESVNYTAGDRVCYEGTLYRVLQTHTSLPEWPPDITAALFAKVLIPTDDEGQQTEIPDWEQPGATNPYMKGDKVRYEGHIYESLIDNNVWSPFAYPHGWQLLD